MKIKIFVEEKIGSVENDGEEINFSIEKVNSFLGYKFYFKRLPNKDSNFFKKLSLEIVTEIVKSAFNIGDEKIKIEY
jgi:hypothetical protein